MNWIKLNQNIFSKNFTDSLTSFRIVITWKTRNIWSLFPLKDKNKYKSCVIYKGGCSCGLPYIGETKIISKLDGTNIITQLQVQNHWNNFKGRHFLANTFLWAVISNAPKNAKTRKNLKESSYIALWKNDINEQKDFERLVLFRNCVTYSN